MYVRRLYRGLSTYLGLSYCTARNAAIDLAEGIGQVVPEHDTGCQYDHEEWEGVEPCVNNDRRRPLIWMSSSVIKIMPPYDGFASYGRPDGWESEPHCEDRDKAIAKYAHKWQTYEHLGQVPDQIVSENDGEWENWPTSDDDGVSAVRGAGSDGVSAVRGADAGASHPVTRVRANPKCLAGKKKKPLTR